MSMRTHRLVTHLRPDEAYAIIELLDPLRDVLMQVYGQDISRMLQQAATTQEPAIIDARQGDLF